LWVTLVMLLANAAGNYVLIFGHFGFPIMGLKGAALASVGSNIIGAVALIILIHRHRVMRRFHIFGRMARMDWARVRDLFRIGLPIAATMVFEVAIFSAAAFLMGLIGVKELAAHAIALQAAALAFMVPLGIGQAATIRVGMAFGAGDAHWVQRAGRVAMGLGVGFMAFTAMLFWLAPHWVIMLWLAPSDPANTAVIPLAVSFLSMAALFQLFDGAQVVGAGLLRGLQDTRVPMVFAAIGYWIIGLGGAVVFGFYTPMSGQGIWLGLVIGLASVAVLMGVRWKRRGPNGLIASHSS
jgi:multidrug resistance protein, MATE family